MVWYRIILGMMLWLVSNHCFMALVNQGEQYDNSYVSRKFVWEIFIGCMVINFSYYFPHDLERYLGQLKVHFRS